MTKTHDDFMKKYPWYAKWHKHPQHQLYHWGFFILFVLVISGLLSNRIDLTVRLSSTLATSLNISNITDNASDYPGGQIPKYEKYEITFDINGSVATNFQLPYDSAPPPYVPPGQGITVNAQFSQDNFLTVYTQPAFYYQNFDYNQVSGTDWIYPTNNFSWKVRFAPNKEGTWQYRLTAQDAFGSVTSPTQTFTVVTSNNHGFVKPAQKDSRYFEFDDGTYFPATALNWSFNLNSPISGNQAELQKVGQNGIKLLRVWLSYSGIFSSWAKPWKQLVGQLPNGSVDWNYAYPGSDTSMHLQMSTDPTVFLGWQDRTPAVKPNTKYHISIRYLMPKALTGPSAAGKPFGLVAKLSDFWLGDPTQPGTGTPVTPYASSSPTDVSGNPQWATLEGSFTTGPSHYYLGDVISTNIDPFFYLALENITNQASTGGGIDAYIDRVDIKEDLGGGNYGVNIITKPWAGFHQYMDQRRSFGFDQILSQVEQNDVYLKLVVLEKNDEILNCIHFDGSFTSSPEPNWATCDNGYFYGDFRNMTKTRWLEQAWWRYVQARWGYSTNIHSWELLNEGTPGDPRHFTLADEFGKYMKRFVPNKHMVTTSFWWGWIKDAFWANPSYPNIDYADTHLSSSITQGISNGDNITGTPNDYFDSTQSAVSVSSQIGAKTAGGVNKPTIRGETGFVVGPNSGDWTKDFAKDTNGVWLHNFVWGGLHPGGVMEEYWWVTEHILTPIDLRNKYVDFYNFVKDIPLNNGNYVDAAAVATDPNARVLGQKDTVSGKAHLWIANKKHTWCAVVGNISGCPVVWDNSRLNGTVTMGGFSPNSSYSLEWWQFDNSVKLTKVTGQNVTSDANGNIILDLGALPATVVDVAVKIAAGSIPPPPPPLIPDTTPPVVSVFDVVPRTIASPDSTTISWTVTDSGGSHLNRAETKRAAFVSSSCDDSTKTGCAWVDLQTIQAPNGIDTWTSSTSDSPAAGVYFYGIHVVDNADNIGYEPTQIKVTTSNPADAISPTVSITSPANGSTARRRSKVTISATASDNLGVTKVEFYVNGSILCSLTKPSYACIWSVPGAKGKSYRLQVKAYDAAGNVGASSIVNVTSK